MAAVVIILGYLLGSIPTAYLVGRAVRGIDLRHYGSGTVSGTAVYYHVARPLVVAVGLFDIAKGALPTWLALRLGLELPIAVLAGLAAIVGHNWPVFLSFVGGRGLGTFLGVLLIIFPWGFPWLLIWLTLGRLAKVTAVGALLGLASLPFVMSFTGQPSAVILAALAMVALTAVKRLEANRLPLPAAPQERRRVLWRRLWLDRDVPQKEAWIYRLWSGGHWSGGLVV
jgi:glycerol-3-phosphate acyltransferase PlsY